MVWPWSGPSRVHQRRLVIKLHEHERQFHERTSRALHRQGVWKDTPTPQAGDLIELFGHLRRRREAGPGLAPRVIAVTRCYPTSRSLEELARCNRARTFTSTSSGR